VVLLCVAFSPLHNFFLVVVKMARFHYERRHIIIFVKWGYRLSPCLVGTHAPQADRQIQHDYFFQLSTQARRIKNNTRLLLF